MNYHRLNIKLFDSASHPPFDGDGMDTLMHKWVGFDDDRALVRFHGCDGGLDLQREAIRVRSDQVVVVHVDGCNAETVCSS